MWPRYTFFRRENQNCNESRLLRVAGTAGAVRDVLVYCNSSAAVATDH